MKIILSVILIVSFCLTANADPYVTINKTTGEPAGFANISSKAVADWAKKHILVEADESYRGKHGWEIKYENGNLRHATEQEIANYHAQKEQEAEQAAAARKKQDLSNLLDDEDIKTKIKNIKKDVPVAEPIMLGEDAGIKAKWREILKIIKQ